MNQHFRWLIISGAVLIVAMFLLRGFEQRRQASSKPLPVLGTLSDFVVTNQAGRTLTRADLQGRPWAIDLIFTRCPGPCATLTGVMRTVQEGLPPGSEVGLMSITSDTAYDTPAVLTAYADRFEADTNRWHFVTGTKEEIRRLATEQLYLVLLEKPEDSRQSADDLFLHSTLIVLIDREGRLRATVEGLQPNAADQVLAGLRQLEKEK